MLEKYKKEFIILGIVIIIPVILIVLYYIFRTPVQNKITKNGDMPYIDINSNDVESINNYVSEIYKTYSVNKKTKLNYKTNTYKNIISVLVTIDEYNVDTNEYFKKFVSFNVKKDGTFIDKEELSNMFGYSLEEIVDKVENKLRNYYDAEVSEGYVEGEECNFNCYLTYARGIDNILDEISLVVENQKLVAYINLSKDNVNGDKEYFDELKEPYKLILE